MPLAKQIVFSFSEEIEKKKKFYQPNFYELNKKKRERMKEKKESFMNDVNICVFHLYEIQIEWKIHKRKIPLFLGFSIFFFAALYYVQSLLL